MGGLPMEVVDVAPVRLPPALHEEVVVAHVRGPQATLGHALEVVGDRVRHVDDAAAVAHHLETEVDVLERVLVAGVEAAVALELGAADRQGGADRAVDPMQLRDVVLSDRRRPATCTQGPGIVRDREAARD